MLKIIEKTKIWFSISLIIITIGMVFLFTKGLNYGIDFTGGTLVEINIGQTFNQTQKNDIDAMIKKYDKDATINSANDSTEIDIKSRSEILNQDKINLLLKDIKAKYAKSSLKSQDFIGSSVGKEMKQKTLLALGTAIIFMLIYVGFRFEFKFGAASMIALLHDVLMTIGFYAAFQIQVDLPFVAAILTIIGYSINDTIVVFDRIRENLTKMRKADIVEVTNVSITQTMTRSIYTVLTVLIMCVSVGFFVPAVRNFAIPLIVGIISGCYSSIFIASPLWVVFKNMGKKSNKGKVISVK